MYTVKELAEIAGVSSRTLRYYDQIELLKPSQVSDAGYRKYDESALFRLQQILFYREMDLGLKEVKAILDDPVFDVKKALHTHRQSIVSEMNRLGRLQRTVEKTIQHMEGEIKMSSKTIFDGFDKETQKTYEKEAAKEWGDLVKESAALWSSYSEERQQEILEEGDALYREIVAAMNKGADSPEVRSLMVRWHQHLRYFYEPSIEVIEGLGEMYSADPAFNAKFSKLDPGLPDFLKEAIGIYADELETVWLEKELETLEE